MKHHVTDQFPDYMSGELDRGHKAAVEAHLQDCTLCREEFDTLLRLSSRLDDLPELQPGPEARARFFSMLEAYQEGARHQHPRPSPLLEALNSIVSHIWPAQPAVQFLLTAVLFAAGLFGGTWIAPPDAPANELAHLRTEVQSMGHLLALSLMNQQSASERIRGVSWTSQIEQPDPQVLTALVNALRYDPNVNVRLASVDALGHFIGNPTVREEILGALSAQSSPLVQIALVDLVVSGEIPQSTSVLTRMADDPDVTPVVRQRIEEGLRQLSSGGRS